MNKIQFEKLLKPLVEIYDEIELELIRKIILRIDEYDDIKGSLEWYLKKITELGTIDNDLISTLDSRKRNIKEILKMILGTASRKSEYIEVLKEYYNKGLLETNPTNLFNSTSVNRLIDDALKDTEDIMQLINTKALEGAKESYMNIINKAYIETSSGVYTYQEAIRNALKEFAKEGIQVVHYANGRSLGIESVVRRDVITRTNKLVGDIDLQNAKELGTDLVYVDQHLGARTRTKYTKNDYEAHDEWQGKVYTLDPSNTKYPNFYENTGYGEMLGLKGINCYHNFRPFFEWESIPEQIDLEENKKEYELLQKQRSYERKIRQLKREKVISNTFYSKEEKKVLNSRFNKINKEYEQHLIDNKLNRDYSREYIDMSEYNTTKLSELYKDKSNIKQYNKYKEVLDDKAPSNIEEFIKIKYNNPKKWNKLKSSYLDEKGIYTDEQANQFINLVKDKLLEGNQGKHLINHNNYIEGNSYLTISNDKIKELVNDYATMGEKKYNVNTQKWTKTEKIVTNEIIGVYINKNYNQINMTNSFVIKYSNNGYHIVPANYTEKDD